MPWFGMIFGPILMIAVLVTVVVVVVLIVRWLGGAASGGTPPGPAPTKQKTALDILEERFARGEIDAEEFRERKRLLNE